MNSWGISISIGLPILFLFTYIYKLKNRRLENKHNEALKKLETAIKARDEFISMASHELKTPLTSLQLQTQMSKKIIHREGVLALTPEKIFKLIQNYDTQILRLSRLVEDMLDVSRMNQGRLPLHFEEFDLGEWVKEVVARFSDGGGISVHVKPITVNLDRFRIEQVVTNLLTNALKYGGGSPIEVHVEGEDDIAKIIVRDQGPGIAQENQERIFKPFERAICSRKLSGLGLGLHIANQIATAHGGKIKIQSELGMGAAFIVELPRIIVEPFEVPALALGLGLE